MTAAQVASLWVLAIIAPLGTVLWIGMQWLPLWLLGLNLKTVMDEITLPEAVLFGMYAIGSAHLLGSLLSRFV